MKDFDKKFAKVESDMNRRFWTASFGMFAVAIGILAALGFGVVWLSNAFVDGLEQDCARRCEGRDKEVASFTIFGCECREPKEPSTE